MRKTHPLRRAVLAGAGTVSVIVLLLALKPTTDPSLARAAAPGTPAASSAPAGDGTSPTASATAAASPTASAPPSPGPSTTAAASASASARTPASRTATAAPVRTGTAPAAPRTTEATPGGSTTRSVTGATVSTQYGPVQVRITLDGGTITGATAVQSPSSTPRSREISSTAVPQLNQRTLAAQSADIDSVSGATYTSAGYRQSLQSALDRAGV
ncbi:FMN-binding protein [Streptomyces sp. HB2AG]|uniref:FMN-binding protein n=1 Tax=Streptomyces sp. HB2AG TaxID=2983400 RepID=UPI0022AA0476|nr:FMN-binding protein [Streptomyces sp. HB2AG]MCZ2527299.1 FMN-binding protein [Streptomyces sp. HB2AG]